MPLTRARLVLAIAAVVLAVAGVIVLATHHGAEAPPVAAHHPTRTTTPTAATRLTAHGVQAAWVVAENRKPGTPSWAITRGHYGGIEGFADHVYAAAGQQVKLYVSSRAPTFHVEAYRVGYYGGVGGRLVWRSAQVSGHVQPPCPRAPGTNMIACDDWTPSLTVPITDAFVQGDYLFKLVGAGQQQNYVPMTVWDPDSHGTYLFKNDVFTWQAWNPYGGYDYYVGQGPCPRNVYPLCTRARVVSYDRPYGDGEGTGDFMGLELPLVRLMEQDGLDVSYATDLTVAEHPEIAAEHRVLLSLGHDECWSLPERQSVTTAEQRGLNLAFFGASAVLRHVRSQASPLGQDRQLVDYRDATADPMNGKGNPREVTGNTWSAPPASWPESPFVGESYNGFLEPTIQADMTVTDAGAWLFTGTGLRDGSVLANVIGSDVDSLEPREGHPADVQILAHSALPANKAQAGTRAGPLFYSDMTYYSDPTSGAGVWDSGTNNWIPALDPTGGETQTTAAVVRAITENLFHLLGQGPAGKVDPSVGNMATVYGR